MRHMLAAGTIRSATRTLWTALVTFTLLLTGTPTVPLVEAYAAQIVVEPGDGLQAAISAASAGDTLVLSAGEYTTTGQVLIDKALTITGAGIDETVVKTTWNTTTASITTSLTTGWFRVATTGSLALSDLTLDGEHSAGYRTGAAVYASGPLRASRIRVTDVKWDLYAGTGLALIGAGHEVVGCTFDDIERLGLYIGAGSALNAPALGAGIAYGTLVADCTFTGAGTGDHCQYSMEIGRSGSAVVRNIDVSGFSGVTAVNGWNSAGLLVDSYYGSGVASLTLEDSAFHDSRWGVEVGFHDQPRDTILHMSRTTFERVDTDLNVGGATSVVSVPTGSDNVVIDRNWLYHWFDATGTTMTPPPALPEGFINWTPVGSPDEYTVPRNARISAAAPGFLGNDHDSDGDTLTVVPLSGVTTGTLQLEPTGEFEYVPPPGYTGVQRFTYALSDWLATSAPTTVTLTVANTAPVAEDDSWNVRQGELLLGGGQGVLGNDSDENGDAITARLLSDAANGSLVLHADGTFIYQPDASFVGTDTFTYAAYDGSAFSAPATVSIAVGNRQPTAVADAYAVPSSRILAVSSPGVLSNDVDEDGDRVIGEVLEPPVFGAAVLASNGSFIYVPRPGFPGTDEFSYRAYDGRRYSDPATVTITGAAIPYPTEMALSSVSTTLSGYGAVYRMTGTLTAEGVPVAGRAVVLQLSSSILGPFSNTSVVTTTGADGSFSLPHVPTLRVFYRVSFPGEGSLYEPSISEVRRVLPIAAVGKPYAPKVMRLRRSSTVYGFLKPRHAAGSYPVRIYRYRYIGGGKWRSYGYVKAKSSPYSSYTRYSVSIRLPARGRWRLRAHHPGDTLHAPSWSAKYRYVTVK